MSTQHEDGKQMTTSPSPAGRPVLGRVAGGAAALVRAVAGVPAGVSRTRRGTFLVVVIGTLALLAVIAIAHFAIGQSDRRTSNSLERATKIDDIPGQFAKYVQDTIARDSLGVVPEETNELAAVGSADYFMRFLARREANDRPATDWRLLTTDPNVAIVQGGIDLPNRQFFTPEGVGCDPWLADIAPVWLNWEGIAPPTRNEEFRYRRDWGHISNLAPDGRFVNLVNLRNNFTAESGFGVAAGGKPRTSQGLTLLEPADAADPLSPMQTSIRTDFGLSAGAGVTPNLARQRAATWDSRQRGAFRAVKEWSNLLPSDAAYADNQWADADRDGILDSRWFELADARDLDTVRSFLQTDSRMRWFFATRIIDLSGLINVNTATDQSYEPGAAFPMGLNPADIDLKRLLSLQDAYAEWGVGYNALLQPLGAPQAQIPDNYSGLTAQLAKKLGKGAYESLRWSIEGGMVPERYDNPTWDWLAAGVSNTQRAVLRQNMWRGVGSSMAGASYDSASRSITLPSQFPASDMGELLGQFGANNPLETSRVEAAADARGGARAGMAGVRESGLGPFRSNRDGAYETNKTGRLQGQGVVDTGITTPEAMLAVAVDVRSQVTTVSGAKPVANLNGNDVMGSGYPRANEYVLANDERLSLGTKLAGDLALSGVDLFRMYARSLAPALKIKGVWPVNGVMPGGGGADFQKSRTLFYGHQGPELALLAAGSMAVNAEVLLSRDGQVTNPRTLVFSTDYARRLYDTPNNAPKNANSIPASPWFRQGAFCLESEAEGLPPMLATGSDATIQTPVLNLYGFEPQAFITEVGCFTVWRDTPSRFGGDVDMGRIDINHPNDPPDRFITIRGNVDGVNSDFMFRCLTIQLHNPFDEPVAVSSVIDRSGVFRMDDWPAFQYVKIMNAAQTDVMGAAVLCDATIRPDRGMQVAGLTLQPGETVACCLFNMPPNMIADRLSNQGADAVHMFNTQPEAAAFLRNWANTQFVGDRVDRAVFVLGVNDTVTDVTTSFKNYVDDPNATKGMTLQLWKSKRADMTDLGGPNEVSANAANNTGNDQLLDRFRIPIGQTLDARIKEGPAGSNNVGEDVNGAWGGSENRPFNALNNYNTGLTVMRWASASRPSDPAALGASEIPVGAVPAYLLEPQNPAALWHKYHTDSSGVPTATTLTVTKSVVELMENPNHEAEFVTADWTAGAVGSVVCKSISLAPFKKDSTLAFGDVPAIPQNRDSKAFELVRDLMPRAARADKGFNGGAAEGVFQAKVPGRTTSTSTLRAADLMLPMAISPWESPLMTNLQAQADPNIRYLTAAEAFAIAYGYEQLPAPQTAANAADPKSLYNPTPAAPNNPDGNIGDTADRPVISAGHIVLDDFVPFYDGNQNGRYDRDNAYNGLDYAQVTRKDIRFGLGIPAALNIMDQVTALEEQYGSLRRATPGLININTATPTVLRCLPMLTPADRAWGGSNDLIWSNNLEQTKTNIDLAASVLSYRDKRLTFALPSRALPAAFDGDGQAPARGFASANGRLFTEIQSGRAMATQMDGIREEIGFLSLGELGCVIQRERDDRGGTNTDRGNPRSIDFLGFNNPDRSAAPTNDVKGFNSLQFKDITANPGPIDVDAVRNDFAERIQVLSALSNVASVRSDVFACWFIVRGYTQEDCENLGPDDPMTPSVERRFLMVIDRSNVSSLQKDPKPRVILFKELPKD